MALEALAAGAVEVIAKPGPAYSVGEACTELVGTIKFASRAQVNKKTLAQDDNDAAPRRLSMVETTNKKPVLVPTATSEASKPKRERKLPDVAPAPVSKRLSPEDREKSRRIQRIMDSAVKKSRYGTICIFVLLLLLFLRKPYPC